ALRLSAPRIGLVDVYGGSMDAGWVRLIFDSFDFPYRVVYPPELDRADLRGRYDALVFVPGLVPEPGGGGGSVPDSSWVPPEYHERLGTITSERTIPAVRRFIEEGGTVLAMGSSTRLAEHLALPVSDHLVEATAEGTRPLTREEFFIPGSVLRTRVDASHPLAHGTDGELAVMFERSPVYRVAAGARGVTRVGWFDTAQPLMSGWAWGQERLEGGATVLEAELGEGKLLLFGPEITFRGQSHEAMKLLFNGLYYGTAREQRLR
ncbi:MAG TPA: hypothetical protein VMK65_12950, partial [Longimicrobiales bacterium]|nr:hypothetical protein [Longimicrobiales bacterium]